MSEMFEKVAEAYGLTDEQKARVQGNVAEFMKAAQQDPELALAAMEKLGFLSAATKGLLKEVGKNALIATGATLAASAAASGLGKARDAFKGMTDKRDMERGYGSMMEAAPHMRKMDQAKLRGAYRTLHTFNPSYAKDPLVASSFVQDAMDMERPFGVNTINALVQSHSQMTKSKGDPSDISKFLGPGMQTAFGAAADAASFQRKKQHDYELQKRKMEADKALAGFRHSLDAKRENLKRSRKG